MDQNPGGMQFSPGRPIQISPPPEVVGATAVRVASDSEPLVDVGQPVRHGQQLAEPTASQPTGCVCPVSGLVGRIDTETHTFQGGDRKRYHLTLEPVDEHLSTVLDVQPPRNRTVSSWLNTLDHMCPWAVGDGNVGLLAQLTAAGKTPPDTLICVGLDHYPPYPVASSLLMSFSDDAVLGTQILADVVGAQRTTMLASRNPAVLGRLRPSCRNFQLPLVTKDNVYPSADPTLVVRAHTPNRRHLSVGANPVADAGVVLISPWTAIRIARWFTLRQFDLVRPVMIGWAESKRSFTLAYAVPGQPLSSLDDKLAGALENGQIVLRGNPMAGRPVPTPVTLTGETLQPVVPMGDLLLTVLGAVSQPQPEPCISCGWCVEICPTGLRPNRLFEWLNSKRSGGRAKAYLDWCIECGLCSHVCPSALPLAQSFGHQKSTLEPPVTDRPPVIAPEPKG